LGANPVGSLGYTYDAVGRALQVSGSFAATNLPSAIASASYDAANQLSTWAGTSLSYDANGNMTSDGTKTFTWNARNELTAISGTSGANFQYDLAGRRSSKTVGSATTTFRYDGTNVMQEGSSVNVAVLSGGIDEWLQRVEASSSYVPLRDALGNVVALTDSTGAVQTQYQYEPFGMTSVVGTSNTNVNQFTGRENDGGGIYYYRHRYYSTILSRFITQDPIGYLGGINPYIYTSNDPINLTDPLGLYDGWDFTSDLGTFSEAFADALTFNSASRLNNALGADVAVKRCGWVHKAGTASGIAFSIVAGGEGLPNALKGLSRGAKGTIGEGLSLVENSLKGSRLIGQQVRAAEAGVEGLTTVFDSVWDSGEGIYYVESKFGTSGLTAAQRAAANALGDAYQVERWGYDFFTRVGGYFGGGYAAAGSMSGR
jgi:RHS repeat-associated protein